MQITILGCGWLGLALARHWAGRHALVLTTTRSERLPELEQLGARAELLEGHDSEAMGHALAGSEAVVLTLAPRGERQVDAEAYSATYLATCRSLLQRLPELPRLRQIIYTSSCGVYGDAAGAWIDEATPPEPRDDHAAVLLEAEQLLLAASDPPALAVAVLRLGALHGPGRELGPRLARLAGSRRRDDGRIWSNWIHREDAVSAIDLLLMCGAGGVFNGVDGKPATLRQLVDAACAQRGLEPVVWGVQDPTPGDSGPGANALPDRRIRSARLLELGFRPAQPSVLDLLQRG